jgi:cytochrome P450
MRGAMNRPFTPEGLSGEGAAKRMAELVSTRSKGMAEARRFNALNELRDLALDIIFGVLGVADADLPWWREKYQSTLLAGVPVATSVPFSPAWFARRANAQIGERLRQEAARAQAESTPGLLAALAQGRDENGKGLSPQELVANVRILGLAGHETTASILTWSLAYLSQDDALWDRLVAEAKAVGHIPQTPGDLKNHPVAEAIFRESLRLHTPLTVMSREVVIPAEIAGHTLPVGTPVRLPLWLWNRDPGRYPEPERYNPDRWLGRDRKPDPVETSPFGGGAHFCLGYHLAILEGVQLLTSLAQRAQGRRLRLVKGALPAERYFPLIQPMGKDTDMVWDPA